MLPVQTNMMRMPEPLNRSSNVSCCGFAKSTMASATRQTEILARGVPYVR